VAAVVLNYAVVLQPAHGDSRGYAELICETANRRATISTKAFEERVVFFGNQPFKGERICLRLLYIPLLVVTFYKILPPAVEKNVASLVKKREPQVIVSL